eukprot:jgi/Botrbrau1/4552/Bobra.60_2s0039.1
MCIWSSSFFSVRFCCELYSLYSLPPSNVAWRALPLFCSSVIYTLIQTLI